MCKRAHAQLHVHYVETASSHFILLLPADMNNEMTLHIVIRGNMDLIEIWDKYISEIESWAESGNREGKKYIIIE